MSGSFNKAQILDACCGSRMFWFDKENKNAIYMDNRILNTTLCDGRKLVVNPDIVADFKSIPFDDETFYLVIFDPPHLLHAGNTSYLKAKYGTLEPTWKDDIKQGLAECWRVLKENGTLIFKWNEEQVLFSDVKGLLPSEPIIGQRRGKTIWLVFFKSESGR
jgi:ubiquinone/menaquinone biosynthesis C-methylase UbiE